MEMTRCDPMSEIQSFEIPGSWTWTSIGEIAQVIRQQIDPSEAPNSEFNYLSIENIESNTGELVRFQRTKGKDIGSAKIKFTIRDVLYSKLRPYLNKVHLPLFDGISATDLIPLRPDERIKREYLAYYLRTRAIVEYLNGKVHGIQLPRVPVVDILNVAIPLPPKDEQERIVLKIEELFAQRKSALDSLSDVAPILKKFRQVVLTKAFTGQLIPQEPNDESADKLLRKILMERRVVWQRELRSRGKDPTKLHYKPPMEPESVIQPEIPATWTWAAVDQLCFMVTDGEHDTPKRQASGIPLLSARNVIDGSIRLEDVDHISKEEHQRIKKRLTITAGDVLLTCSGTVGRSCVVPPNFDCSMVRSVALLKPVYGMVDSNYLSLALRSSLLQEQINQKKTQTAQSNIFQGKIRALVVPLAPLNEQRRVVQRLRELFGIASEIERSMMTAKRKVELLDQAILDKAFRGELVPQDPNDEPASFLLDEIRTASKKQKWRA
jgi:type I restriction enzyme, S subunit